MGLGGDIFLIMECAMGKFKTLCKWAAFFSYSIKIDLPINTTNTFLCGMKLFPWQAFVYTELLSPSSSMLSTVPTVALGGHLSGSIWSI